MSLIVDARRNLSKAFCNLCAAHDRGLKIDRYEDDLEDAHENMAIAIMYDLPTHDYRNGLVEASNLSLALEGV